MSTLYTILRFDRPSFPSLVSVSTTKDFSILFPTRFLHIPYLAMDTYVLRAQCMVQSQLPLVAPISSATLFIVAYQMISLLPDGSLFEAWTLHSRDESVGLDIGMRIAICCGQRGLDSTGSSRPLATADITSVAYCDKEQVIFRMKIKGDLTTLCSPCLVYQHRPHQKASLPAT